MDNQEYTGNFRNKGQSGMDNQEILATLVTTHRTKTKKTENSCLIYYHRIFIGNQFANFKLNLSLQSTLI